MHPHVLFNHALCTHMFCRSTCGCMAKLEDAFTHVRLTSAPFTLYMRVRPAGHARLRRECKGGSAHCQGQSCLPFCLTQIASRRHSPLGLCARGSSRIGHKILYAKICVCRTRQALDAMEKLQGNLKREQVLQSELSIEVFERVRSWPTVSTMSVTALAQLLSSPKKMGFFSFFLLEITRDAQ